MKKKWLLPVSIVFGIILICYFSLGLFIIQPMGFLPEGASVLYFRLGMNIPFISSADGIILKKNGEVSLLTRGLTMAALAKPVIDRKILSLPYSHSLYLYSTGGVELEK
jgi:hypothetical protein